MLELSLGFHSIQTILETAPSRLTKVFVSQDRQDKRMQTLLASCRAHSIDVIFVARAELDERYEGNHQGVVAELKPRRHYTEADLLTLISESPTAPLLLILDGVTDPHNLGACLRTADAAGVTALIVPKDNSASLNEAARKVASGAADTVPLIHVTNLARAMKKMQELGVWITGTAGEASLEYAKADLSGPRAIVMGAEGKGMRRLTRENCDELVKIPMLGAVSSLNVSVASGVLLFEAVRQRR